MSSTWSVEVECKSSAFCIFKAGITEWHNLAHKLLPEIFTSITILSGDAGPGTIRHIDLSPGGPYSFVKDRIDFIDFVNFEAGTTALDGGNLGKKLKSSTSHFKVIPSVNGSVARLVETYEAIPGVDYSDDAELLKQIFVRCVKALDSYIQANPKEYA